MVDSEAITNKYFSFYLPSADGKITFGEFPSEIVDDTSKILWAPTIHDNVNPWSV